MKHFIFYFLIAVLALKTAYASPEDEAKKRFNEIALEVEKNAFSHPETAKEFLAELQAITSKRAEDINFTIRTFYREALINYYQLINDSTLLKRCQLIANTWKSDQYPFEHALLNFTLCMCYSIDGNFSTAFSFALKALEEFKEIEEQKFVCKLFYSLGNISNATQGRKAALDYYEKAMNLAVYGDRDYYLPYIAYYSNIIFEEGKRQMGIDSLKHILKYADKIPDIGLLVAASFNLGSIYYAAQNDSVGAEYYELSQHIIDAHGVRNQTLQFGLFYNYSKSYLANEDYKNALKYAYLAKEIADENKGLTSRSIISLQLATIYDKVHKIDSAYYYLLHYNELRTQIVNNSRTVDAYKSYISIYLESLEQGLVIASQQKKLFRIISISVTVIFLLLLGFFIELHQRRRNLAQQINRDQEIKKLQEDKIELQQRELTSHTLLLLRKNDLLQEVNRHLQRLPQDLENVKAIKQIVKDNLAAEQVWDNFVIHFNNVHPDFFEKLKQRAPALTENNLRLCAYLRISMPPKQIAQVLNISFENVRKSSYRLKKKLLLGEEDNLYDFLRNI